MHEFRFHENPLLPRLAWCTRLTRSTPVVDVEHGSWVETGRDYFVDGVWNGPFGDRRFSRFEVMLGSGGALADGRVAFTPTTHTMERLYSLRSADAVFVSNSLAFLLQATGSTLNRRYWRYEADLMSFLRGYKKARTRLPLANGRTVELHYHRTFLFDSDLTLQWVDPPQPPGFTSYRGYIDYLVETIGQLHKNAVATDRRISYTPLTTISSGYDSPACAVLARHIGCRRSVTFTAARTAFASKLESTDDSGEPIAALLGLEVDAFSRDRYLDADDFPEALFLATGSGGDDVVLSALADRLERTMLFTGMLGDTLWSTSSQDPAVSREYRFRFPAGASMQEFRLKTGFVHVPVPLLTFTRHAEIQKISTSDEMRPWRLDAAYDRPIPRRLVEESGVPRDAFATEKRAITQPFWLQKASAACMSAASLQDFERFVQDTARSYPLGTLQLALTRDARRAFYRARKMLTPNPERDPYFSDAYVAVATTEPLRFHWAIDKVSAAYRDSWFLSR